MDWDFLDLMLERFSFCDKWRTWITSASTSILVNGRPTKEFRLERGLRQGEPLSHFLYLLVAESLSIMISRATGMGHFEAAEVGRHKIKIPHLQYADDIIFMGIMNKANAGIMKKNLEKFRTSVWAQG